jgi:hypothetical protein
LTARRRPIDDFEETAMLSASIRPHILAILITGALISACSNGGDSTAAQTGASGPADAASSGDTNTAAANGNGNNDDGDGTPTGLAPAPWAMSAPQPASDGLRPPVIHTVD